MLNSIVAALKMIYWFWPYVLVIWAGLIQLSQSQMDADSMILLSIWFIVAHKWAPWRERKNA